jgi:predicted nicotinamide N-methyase
MTREDSLRNLLLQSFALRSFELRIGTEILAITTAEDIDTLIDGITEDEFRKDERLPYWADVWHSAVALGLYLLEHPSIVHEKLVLELGCGLGVPGILAARLGAKVTFADYDAQALLAAEYNMLRNAPGTEAHFLNLDFRTRSERTWPVIIAADIVYEKRFIDPLVEFFSNTLGEGGSVVLAEPNRLIAIPFFERIEEAGLRYTRESVPATLHDRSVDVSIYTISHRESLLAQ